ncbi:MAG: DMT family protein [Deltaproteobacteria bacterium]|nr:DMT family protein [Deltaproteobacteria bacterium]
MWPAILKNCVCLPNPGRSESLAKNHECDRFRTGCLTNKALPQLKVIQEVLTMIVFAGLYVFYMKQELT